MVFNRQPRQRVQLGIQISRGAEIANQHDRPLMREKPRRGLTGARQAQHHDLLAFEIHFSMPFYLSLSVLSPITAQINAIIQKRTMICGSFQPLSS
jgi:hypothetical protein